MIVILIKHAKDYQNKIIWADQNKDLRFLCIGKDNTYSKDTSLILPSHILVSLQWSPWVLFFFSFSPPFSLLSHRCFAYYHCCYYDNVAKEYTSCSAVNSWQVWVSLEKINALSISSSWDELLTCSCHTLYLGVHSAPHTLTHTPTLSPVHADVKQRCLKKLCMISLSVAVRMMENSTEWLNLMRKRQKHLYCELTTKTRKQICSSQKLNKHGWRYIYTQGNSLHSTVYYDNLKTKGSVKPSRFLHALNDLCPFLSSCLVYSLLFPWGAKGRILRARYFKKFCWEKHCSFRDKQAHTHIYRYRKKEKTNTMTGKQTKKRVKCIQNIFF